MKICSKCGKKKPKTEYRFRVSRGKRYRGAVCRDCANRAERKRYREKCRFAQSLEASKTKSRSGDYEPCSATKEEIKAAFSGTCEICGVNESQCRQRLHMDHDHKTGKFRGWLCYQCNNLLGRAGDSFDILERASAYLKEHSIE